MSDRYLRRSEVQHSTGLSRSSIYRRIANGTFPTPFKIGGHCGPSIAVTLNENLDYFGQTVNVAARVQSLAESGEICISEALYTAPGVSKLLAGHRVEEVQSPLRGVEGDALVYRVQGRK